MQLDKWQQDILNYDGNLLLCTGRQVGKTTILAQKSAEYLISHPKSRIIVVSLTEDQAQLIIVMTLTYLEKHYKKYIKMGRDRPTKNKIRLKNGSQVLSRPVGQTGDSVRGFTGDVLIVDEASRMPESVWIASKPTLLTTSGQIWMCSTPFGKQGYFYECWLNKHDRWKVYHVSSEEVMKNRPISDSWTAKQRKGAQKLLDEEKKDLGIISYSQEYLGRFMDDIRRFFSDKWIEQVCTLKRRPKRPQDRYFLGLDIARMGNDAGTFEIINKVNKTHLEQVENIVTKKKLTTQTFDNIINLNKTWNFKQIGIDAGAGSLGVGILDFLLREPSVASKVITLNNRKITLDKYNKTTRGLLKEDMYELLKALGERGFINLLDDEDLILSFRSVQIELVQKEGQQTKIKIFGRDTHIVEGLTRAAWLANQKHFNSFFYSM